MDTTANPRAELMRRRLRGLGHAEQAGGITPARRDRPLPLSFAQRGLWLLDQIRPGGTDYLTPVRLRLRGAHDPSGEQQRGKAATQGHLRLLCLN